MNREVKSEIHIMEVCGTHTCAIAKSGIGSLLPQYVKLLSGPGCPVCVTNESYIDMAIDLLNSENIILATFGDMIRVRGTHFSLMDKKKKANIVTVYSPENAITLAYKNPDKIVVFLAVGFATTAPIIAATIKNVYKNGPDNLFFLTGLKRMEPILSLILQRRDHKVDGLICPGHVAAVLGAHAFEFVTEKYQIPAVVCGFQSEDIKNGIYHLLDQIQGRRTVSFLNLYERCVTFSGNKIAQKYMEEVYQIEDGLWRGIGLVLDSALGLREKYEKLDARKKFGLGEQLFIKPSPCQCSEIILGIKAPNECKLFGKSCSPKNPLGPCMISTEGSCAVHYRYGGMEFE